MRWEAPLLSTLAVLAALAVAWLLLVAALALGARRQGGAVGLRAALRLLPDLLRLLRGLATDPALPRSVRWRLVALMDYLALPVDLVPDFLPVVVYADDVLIALWALRSVVRRAGPQALARHWSGSAEGLAALQRLLRLPSEPVGPG